MTRFQFLNKYMNFSFFLGNREIYIQFLLDFTYGHALTKFIGDTRYRMLMFFFQYRVFMIQLY